MKFNIGDVVRIGSDYFSVENINKRLYSQFIEVVE